MREQQAQVQQAQQQQQIAYQPTYSPNYSGTYVARSAPSRPQPRPDDASGTTLLCLCCILCVIFVAPFAMGAGVAMPYMLVYNLDLGYASCQIRTGYWAVCYSSECNSLISETGCTWIDKSDLETTDYDITAYRALGAAGTILGICSVFSAIASICFKDSCGKCSKALAPSFALAGACGVASTIVFIRNSLTREFLTMDNTSYGFGFWMMVAGSAVCFLSGCCLRMLQKNDNSGGSGGFEMARL